MRGLAWCLVIAARMTCTPPFCTTASFTLSFPARALVTLRACLAMSCQTQIVKWKKEWASSHTPRSNIAWECCIQWMAIPSMSKAIEQKTSFIWVAQNNFVPKFKRDINCSLKMTKSAFHLWEKKLNQNFLWICTSTYYVLHNYKVSRNSVEQFQRSCSDKKNRTEGLTDWLTDWQTDWLTDWLTDWRRGKKKSYPLQLVVLGKIKSYSINVHLVERIIQLQIIWQPFWIQLTYEFLLRFLWKKWWFDLLLPWIEHN